MFHTRITIHTHPPVSPPKNQQVPANERHTPHKILELVIAPSVIRVDPRLSAAQTAVQKNQKYISPEIKALPVSPPENPTHVGYAVSRKDSPLT
jgi:hypothetical protein